MSEAATIGHNQAPSDAELLIERLVAESRDINQRAVDLAKSAGRCAITDPDTAGKATLLVSLIMTCKETVEARQKAAKRPHAELATAAYDYFKPTLSLLTAAKAKTLELIAAYNAQIKSAAAEQGMVAPEIRSTYGQKAVERRTWTFQLKKLDDVPREFLCLDEEKVKAHIKCRIGDQPPAEVAGLHFYEATAMSVKR